MSVIESFYNETFTNIRRTTASPTGGDTITTVSSFTGVRRPVTEIAKLFVESNMGKEYDIVCDENTDVKVGDDIYTSGVKYNTLGIAQFEDLEDDSDSYLNIRVVKK